MQDKTQEKPLYFYVANLGSEVQRMLSWKEKGDREAMQNAHQRVMVIIDKIKSFENKSANAEMDILQKTIEENTLNRNQISSYFNHFALRVVNNL